MTEDVWGPLAGRYATSKPKRRLLALDGGGIRGVLTLEILAALERQLAVARPRGELLSVCAISSITSAAPAPGRSLRRASRAACRARSCSSSTLRPVPTCSRRSVCLIAFATSTDPTRSPRSCGRCFRWDAERERRSEQGRRPPLPRAPSQPAARRHAQRDHRFAVANQQQPGGQVQYARSAGLQLADPAVAAGARKHGGAHLLSAGDPRVAARQPRQVVRLRRRRDDAVQ